MKTFAIVFAISFVAAVSALSDVEKAKLQEHRDVCIKETGADATKVETARKGEIDLNDAKLACFASCVMKRIGILNSDGTFNEEVTKAKIPADVSRDQALEVIEKCKTITGSDGCDTALKMFKCYRDNAKFSIL